MAGEDPAFIDTREDQIERNVLGLAASLATERRRR